MEAPRPREGISQFEIDPDARVRAGQYIEGNHALRDNIMHSESAMEVRDKVLSHFGHATELNPNPAPRISELQQAVLAEAVGRWNKARSESR